MAEKQIAHLGMIQGVVSRMSGNSAIVKGWAVTVIAATFAISKDDRTNLFALTAALTTIVFWVLDAYYLSFEHLYRDLYDKVRGSDESDVDFALDVDFDIRRCVRAMLEGINGFFYPFLGLVIVVIGLASAFGLFVDRKDDPKTNESPTAQRAALTDQLP